MSDYKHGALGVIQAEGNKAAQKGQTAIVYVGTAPVHTIAGGAATLNKPIAVENIAQARNIFGYSDEWDDFTLCEAMKAHLEAKGIGPLIFINVFDPDTHQEATGGTGSLTPVNGRITIANAALVILDSVAVATTATPPVSKVKGTDFTVAYDAKKKTVVISELTSGALGTAALTVSWDIAKPGAVDADDVIGTSDGAGLNTGISSIQNVYQETGYIPAMLLVPGFSSVPEVHDAMILNAQKVNGHWDAYVFADIPIVDDEGDPITLALASTWKAANGYDRTNETVFFPLAKGTDGQTYHLSVLAAANFQAILYENNGIPFKTASNTDVPVVENLYLGAAYLGRVYDDTLINDTLNKNGIASAAFTGGRWVLWGRHSADYSPDDADDQNVSETNRMMLFHISNDFQHRRTRDVDKPMTANDIRTIVSEEQARLDALVKIGALTYGKVEINADELAQSDLLSGDFSFAFRVTTTPLARSLKAIVSWTADGFTTYYEDLV